MACTDDHGIVEARNKEIKLRLLDTRRIEGERTFWEFVNLVLPCFLVLVFGVAYYFWRRKKICALISVILDGSACK